MSLFFNFKNKVVFSSIFEYIVCVFNSLLICFITIYGAGIVSGYLKLPLAIHGWIAASMFFLYPSLLLLSFWKKTLFLTKFCFLLMGMASLISGIVIFFNILLFYDYPIVFGGGSPTRPIQIDEFLILMLLSLLGIECIMRFFICQRYGSVFYVCFLRTTSKPFHNLRMISMMPLTYIAFFLIICILCIL